MGSSHAIETFGLTKSFKGKGYEDWRGWTDQLTNTLIEIERGKVVMYDNAQSG